MISDVLVWSPGISTESPFCRLLAFTEVPDFLDFLQNPLDFDEILRIPLIISLKFNDICTFCKGIPLEKCVGIL